MLETNANRFPHVDDVAPISDADDAIFADLRAVLMKHKALNRFGVTLLHDHFEIGEDEILVERCDPESRVLVSTPIKKTELAGESLLETNWTLDPTSETESAPTSRPLPIKTCRGVCQLVAGKGHCRLHYPV